MRPWAPEFVTQGMGATKGPSIDSRSVPWLSCLFYDRLCLCYVLVRVTGQGADRASWSLLSSFSSSIAHNSSPLGKSIIIEKSLERATLQTSLHGSVRQEDATEAYSVPMATKEKKT